MPFGESSVLNDGRQVVAPWKAPGVYIGNAFHVGPELRMPDAALTPSGKVWIVGKDQHSLGGFVWLETLAQWWPLGHTLYGSRAIIRADGEGCRVAFSTSPTTWAYLAVSPTGDIQVLRDNGVFPAGAGAQGMRDWDASGSPRPLYPLDAPLLGFPARGAVTAGAVTIATGLLGPGQVLMAKGSTLGTLLMGGADWPSLRLSADGRFWAGVRYVGEAMLGGAVPAIVPPLQTPVVPVATAKATIDSFETPIVLGATSRAVARVTVGKPDQFRWEFQNSAGWQVAALNPASDLDHHYKFTAVGKFPIRLVTLVGGKITDTSSSTSRVVTVTPAPEPQPPEPTPQPPAGEAPIVSPRGKIFRLPDNAPWRWKGVSAFKLLKRFEQGEDIQPFLTAYAGYNLLRVWPYTPVADWHDQAWEPSPLDVTKRFLDVVRAAGFQVEITLLTDDNPTRASWAKAFVAGLASGVRPTNLLLEIGNEPETHKAIDTAALKDVVSASGFPFASGNYEDSNKAFGSYLVTHTARDNEWPRRAHDLLDFFNGGGPNKPSDPAHKVPGIADEPPKLQDVAVVSNDWRAYFGTAAILGAGATFHSETGKFGQPPTAMEKGLASAALEGLNAFPADAPLGAYSRPVEDSLRTYVVGNYMVRIRPTTPNPPGSGWVRTGATNILWRR